MSSRIEVLGQQLAAEVSALSSASSAVSGERAVELVRLFARIERLAVAGRTLATSRVVATRAWRGRGYVNASTWVAAATQTSVEAASMSLKTAAVIDELPATRGALVNGDLSEMQTARISQAAAADPASEQSLLDVAAKDSYRQLRQRCEEVLAAAAGDEDAHERVRRSRYVKTRMEAGAVLLDARLAPADAAPLIARLTAHAEKLWQRARRDGGLMESRQAYMADALVSSETGGAAPKTTVFVDVAVSAFERGYAVAGERCSIRGIGPIPVSVAKKMAETGTVKHVNSGEPVPSSGTRYIPAGLLAELQARDKTCVVPGCDRTDLEWDHIVPVIEGGRTELCNLCGLCTWHHGQKTHHGWRILGPPDQRQWAPPLPGWKKRPSG